MDFQNMLQTPLDRSSIMERLGDIESYHWDHEQSEYYADYADLFNELALIAAGLYNDLERLIRKLDYADTLPTKRKMAGVEGYRGATWFNEAVSILEETDMSVLLEHEGVYDVDDIDRERGRRSRAIMALTKESMFVLFTEVFNYIVRFIRLSLAFDAICGSIDELERLNSFRQHNGVPQLPGSAYL